MYGLRLVNGDISVKGDGNVALVEGSERVQQELSCWLMEPLGTDVIYKRFGSRLDEMIGIPLHYEGFDGDEPDDVFDQGDVEDEVKRVVDTYIKYQNRQMEKDAAESQEKFMRLWKYGDIIETLDMVETEASEGVLHVRVQLTTGDGTTFIVEQVQSE